MSKSRGPIGPALLFAMALAPASAGAAILGRDAAACASGANDSSVLVKVSGFKARTGTLRIQLYGDNPDDFLASGRKLRRIELPVRPTGPMPVCVEVPHDGDYAVAIRHYVSGPAKSGFNWNDGAGFSRNPHISLLNLKPRLKDVIFHIAGHSAIDVVLNYRHGLSVGPIGHD